MPAGWRPRMVSFLEVPTGLDHSMVFWGGGGGGGGGGARRL